MIVASARSGDDDDPASAPHCPARAPLLSAGAAPISCKPSQDRTSAPCCRRRDRERGRRNAGGGDADADGPHLLSPAVLSRPGAREISIVSPLRRILVPLDGSRTAETALAVAVDLAGGSGGSLYLLRVLPTPAPTAEASVRHRAAVQNAKRYLAATRQKIEAEGVLPVSTAMWSGSVVDCVLRGTKRPVADTQTLRKFAGISRRSRAPA